MPLRDPIAGLSAAAAAALTIAGIATNKATSKALLALGVASGSASGAAVALRKHGDILRLEEENKWQRQVAEKAEEDVKALKNKDLKNERQLLDAIVRYLSGIEKLYKKPFSADDNGHYTDTNAPTPIFQAKTLNRIHIEPFRPESLNIWEPEIEADVYVVFGALQAFTNYQYCRGTSTNLLGKLGASYADTSKPDAILFNRTTDDYLVAELKKCSSDFKLKHKPEDVDILICWLDNETNRSVLPPKVLELHKVAKTAVETAISSRTLMENLFSQLGAQRDRVDFSCFSSPLAQRLLLTLFGSIKKN